jgi:hypothetical protein
MPAMAIADTTRVVASDDALVREVNGEAVLLQLTTSQYHVLDPTSTEMWHALLTAGSFVAAVEAIRAEFDVEEAELRADLERFVQQLIDRGLVRLEPV